MFILLKKFTVILKHEKDTLLLFAHQYHKFLGNAAPSFELTACVLFDVTMN